MSTFSHFSPYEFELLVLDLLEQELGLPLESFTEGRDGGIDLRHSRSSEDSLVVQCKHYEMSGYAALVSQLKRRELEKINKLSPRRYVLATSVRLTPHNKDELLGLLRPYVLSPQDIYGANDLCHLLEKHSSVARRHVKLALTTALGLQRLIEPATLTRSGIYLEELTRKVSRFVSNSALDRARKILDENRVCIISGAPGIGKTTLSEMLLLGATAPKHQAYVISSDVSEAEALFRDDLDQVFFYDDFLGELSFGEKLAKNEDGRLVAFIKRVRRSNRHRLILATREYILQSATLLHEKLHLAKLDGDKCVLQLSDYSRLDRAKILYNHMFFSDAPSSWKTALGSSEQYGPLIDHRNFNPRVIQITIESADKKFSGEQFCDHFRQSLESPEVVWDHAYRRHLTSGAQGLLHVLAIFPGQATLEEAWTCWTHHVHPTSGASGWDIFRDALRVLEGTFVAIDRAEDKAYIRLHSPSVRDYVLALLGQNSELLRDIIREACFFGQLDQLRRHATASAIESGTRKLLRPALWAALRSCNEDFILRSRELLGSADCGVDVMRDRIDGKPTLIRRRFSVEARLESVITAYAEICEGAIDANWIETQMRAILEAPTVLSVFSDTASLLEAFAQADGLSGELVSTLLGLGVRMLVEDAEDTDHVDALLSLYESVGDGLPHDAKEELCGRLMEWALGEADYLAWDADDGGMTREELDRLRSVSEQCGVEIPDRTMEQIMERIHAYEAADHARDLAKAGRGRAGPRPPNWVPERFDTEISSLFSSLAGSVMDG